MIVKKRKTKKRPKKVKYSTLKAKCWKLFSKYIRLRSANEYGLVECVTCGRKMHWEESQAGHFIGGRTNSLLFDERLVHVQCSQCNIFLRGNYVAYTLYMLTKHTREEIEEFQALKNKLVKFTRSDLGQKIEELEKKLESLT
jgi:hypothetical protein